MPEHGEDRDSGGLYRIEAEGVDEDYAKILRDMIEETSGLTLTAFEKTEAADGE